MERTRTDTVTLHGRTHSYPVRVKLPSDRDAQMLRAVYGVCAVIVSGALVWSTVSIGALLGYAAPMWTSYLVAGVFDAAWVVAMVLEYLSRYDRDRASVPRNAGWLALGVSMSLITLHGVVQGGHRALAAGIAGSLVALVSKGVWHMAMRHSATILDPATAGWLQGERNAMGAEGAVMAGQRELNRGRARIQREREALGLPVADGSDTPVRSTGRFVLPEPSGRPEAVPERPDWLHGPGGVLSDRADRTGPDPEWLRASGWEQDADGGWIDPESTVATHPSGRTAVRPQGPRSVRSIGSGIQSIVNTYLADHPDTDTDTADGRAAVRDAVRSVLPDASTDNIGKAIRRARGAA